MKDFGIEYNTIYACPKDDIIYYGEHLSKAKCSKCGTSRYQMDQLTKNVPQKVLCHIPIIPCLQRMFRCNSIA